MNFKKIVTEDIPAAFLMFKRAHSPFTKISPDLKTLSDKIISDCFNGEYYQVSKGHFPQFYMRDFGMCVQALCDLGYVENCRKTVEYALKHYMLQNKVSTTIDPNGECVDFFAYGPDSLAFLLKAILATDFELTKAQKDFLAKQATICYKTVWDAKANTIKQNTYFSSSKDHYKRNAACYDVCMCGLISNSLKELNIIDPFAKIDFQDHLLNKYFTERIEPGLKGFADDLDHLDHSSDAQYMPFYCGIFDLVEHEDIWNDCLHCIQEQGLDDPFPVKYTAKRRLSKELFLPALFAPNYEGNAVWIHTGLCFMEVVAKADTKLLAKYVAAYEEQVKKYHNFLEVYDKFGVPYKSFWYKCDESMLWVSVLRNLDSKFD